MSGIVDDLAWRGLLAQTTGREALEEAFAAGPVSFYAGFDPTASSLHIGHLVQVLTMRRLQLAGNKPYALVGGATGLIGDPRMSGERVMNSTEVVAEWTAGLRAQIEPFLDLEGPTGAVMVNNLDWTAQLSAIELLRDVGKNFRMGRMLSKDIVAKRLNSDEGISYTEFSYQVLQANDFLELYRRYGVTLQYGGNDQWGNIVGGAELIHKIEGVETPAFTTPIVTKADGTKFGKTEGGAVWLDPKLTSPYAFHQFWLNTDDRDVMKYVRFFTFRSHEEIEELDRRTAEAPHARAAQRLLADDLTTLVHGERATAQATAAATALFGRGELGELDEATVAAVQGELPKTEAGIGTPVIDLFAGAGLVKSKGEARRAVRDGGAYLNNRKVTDAEATLSRDDLLYGKYGFIRRGRKTIGAVVVSD